jgi:hypothetical protein
VIGGVTGSVFPHQTFNEAGCSKFADLLELQSVCSSEQPVHGDFQRYAHGRNENLCRVCSATDRLPGMIEAIENQFGGIDKRTVQIEEDGLALGHHASQFSQFSVNIDLASVAEGKPLQ